MIDRPYTITTEIQNDPNLEIGTDYRFEKNDSESGELELSICLTVMEKNVYFPDGIVEYKLKQAYEFPSWSERSLPKVIRLQ